MYKTLLLEKGEIQGYGRLRAATMPCGPGLSTMSCWHFCFLISAVDEDRGHVSGSALRGFLGVPVANFLPS